MIVTLAAASLRLAAATLHVAPDGNDANPGAREKPFATFERARDEIRKLKSTGGLPAGGIVVEARGGTYELSRALELGEGDSGAANAPVVYRARQGERVRLVGGRTVTGWKRVADPEILARLDESARGNVWQADLRALDIADLGEVAARDRRLELFYRDQPMTVARWPNEGFIKITEILGATPVDVRGTKGCKEGKFACESDRLQRWVNDKDIWVHGYWFWDWAEQRHAVESIDAGKRVIGLKPPFHGYGYRKGQWFYAFNLLSELDRPGEWHLDRGAGILYFWPPGPLDRGAAVVSVIPTLVTLKGASHLTLQGLTLEACRGTALRASAVASVRIAGCVIRNTGGHAVSLSGTDSMVIGCDIHDTAAGGIVLEGGDRKTLLPAKLCAENNHIHHYSRWDRVYQPGISLGGVGQRAAHNLIDNAPHMAIGFSGNDHLIEFNEIHDVCYESNDAGAVYAGRNWTMRGTVVRNNYFHHIQGFEGRGCVGVYLDDQFSGTEIVGNVFYRVTRAAMIGGGRDCRIENNVFVDCVPATHVDARGLGWAASGSNGLQKSLRSMPFTEPPWSARYPKLTTLLDEDPMAPRGNVIARNVCVGGRWGDFEGKAKPLVTFESNLIDQDPGFIDAARQNFQLREDSPAFQVGFRRIPIEKIGLYRDALRASWPVEHPVRPPSAPPPSSKSKR